MPAPWSSANAPVHRNKVVSVDDAVRLIKSGDTIATGGFVGIGFAEAVAIALERRFLVDAEPRGLTLVYAAGQGHGRDLAILGMAEVDREGNVNVSKFGPRLAGAGGFINISQNARRVVFVGSFSAGAQDVRVGAGRLTVVRDGGQTKFVERVEHLTFSAREALRRGTPVLYVTERAVFRLEADATDEPRLRLAEVAPGVSIDRDVLGRMAFTPARTVPETVMDAAPFVDAPIQLRDRLLSRPLAERLRFDASTRTLYIDFGGYTVNQDAQITEIEQAVVRALETQDSRVDVVVNYDDFSIRPELLEAYAHMVDRLTARHYARVTRYGSKGFLRARLDRGSREAERRADG